MESYLISSHYDLVTPDGVVESIKLLSKTHYQAVVKIENISPVFKGFEIDPSLTFFNIKSTLAQLGINGVGTDYVIDQKNCSAKVIVDLIATGKVGQAVLPHIESGAIIGKLFAADDRRRVRNTDYLSRMFGRCDRAGLPLLSLGGMQGSRDLALEAVDGRCVAYLSLKNGCVEYEDSIFGFIQTLVKSLKKPQISIRPYLPLHQMWMERKSRALTKGEMLLVKSQPLHIRTVFAKVVDKLLPDGFTHTTASVLQPDTYASGDIYEFFGESESQLVDVPLEFYTLEPHREHVFFEDRDQLQTGLEDPYALFRAFETSPKPENYKSAVFIVKGTQLLNLQPKDWIIREPRFQEFPGFQQFKRQALTVEKYIRQQPSYPFLKAIEEGLITSQGVLLSRFFPSILLKSMLLSNTILKSLKAIYFMYPSVSQDHFFSHEDRAMLNDMFKFALPVYWVDRVTGKILQYCQKEGHVSGMFVPLNQVKNYLNATMFGIYGSNLIEGTFEEELMTLLKGIIQMKELVDHPLLNKDTPLALITGGGPGAMAVGNRVAQGLNILSCANIMDFRPKGDATTVVNEQRSNPHIEAKMTYRLSQLVERQSEFNLDFPIFLQGGVGTDFEFSLEEVRRKVGATQATPMLLFGEPEYWRGKITSKFQTNLKTGTIKGSEWLSNCFFCVQTADQGLYIYKKFFEGQLPIGKGHPFNEEGFVTVSKKVKI